MKRARAAVPDNKAARVVAIIPALNEARVIATVVQQLRRAGFSHVVVCDNGSTDDTAAEARRAGAHVVHEPRRGYGAACLAAMRASDEMNIAFDAVLFVDGDGSAKAEEAWSLVNRLGDGFDLVVGARVSDLQERRALTLPQRVGNVVACAMIRGLWGVAMHDLGPFRAVRADALRRLNMCDQKFGWTVEMQVKAVQHRLRYAEVPVSTRVRVGESKISGTVRGVIGAAHGIIGMILRLRWQEWQAVRALHAGDAKVEIKPSPR
jgi:glycosyltransferase involved in cell wall biosynthesis